MQKLSLFICSLLATSQFVHAVDIAPIVVSATRFEQSEVMTAATISIITREEIERSGAQHIVDLLRMAAGIQVEDLYGDGSRTTISMRGFGGNAAANSLVLIDGRRLNNIDLGSPNLTSINIKNIERIEIIHGSAGALFGDQAVGGVINIITRNAPGKVTEFGLGIGSYNKKHLSAQLSDSITDNFRYRLSAEAITTDNYRAHNEKDSHSAFMRFDYIKSDSVWFLELQSTAEKLQLPGALSTAQVAADRRQANPSYPDDHSNTDTGVVRIATQQFISKTLQVEAELTYRDESSDGVLSSIRSDQNRQSLGLNPRMIKNWMVQHGTAILTFGADIEENDYYINSVFGTTDASQNTQSLYAQLIYPVAQHLTATASLRHAQVESHLTDSSAFASGVILDDDVTVAGLGLSWQYNNSWRWFARLDENYRFAKVDEQTFTSPGIVGLKTQTGTSYELGAEWHNRLNQVKVLVYQLDLDNEIDFDSTAPGPFGPGANVNLPPTQRNGVTFVGKSKLTDQLSLSAQVNYVDASITGGVFSGKEVPFVAEHEASLALNYQQNKSLGWFIEAHYIGARFPNSDYDNVAARLPGDTIYNMHIHYSRENWKSGLRVNNLSNVRYAGSAVYNSFSSTTAYYPAPERNVELYASYQF